MNNEANLNEPKNVSYIFIPFTYGEPSNFESFAGTLDNSAEWEQIHDEIVYMLKYVADKFNSYDKRNCRCFHYRVREERRAALGLMGENDFFHTEPCPFGGEEQPVRFCMIDVQLYCFSTSVGIIAFKIRLEKDDPFWVSNALYHLKKVSREKLFSDGSQTTMLEMAKELMKKTAGENADINFFYYANPSTERANVLTYLEVPPKEDYKKELFYLRRCYGENFLYMEDPESDAKEIHIHSRGIVWGISPEAAVCLVCPSQAKEDFIRSTFYTNFNEQYLFMYMLLLHRKYVMYMFLTEIGIGTYNTLETLEEYRHQLYEFETDFDFSCVTEVPQYQELYEKMTGAFSLKKMYEDVHEPLRSLTEIRRKTAESEQEQRNDRVNKALLMLSVLSFFSALIDSFDFINSFFGWFLNDTAVRVLQLICIIGIVITVFFAFKNLLISKKRKK